MGGSVAERLKAVRNSHGKTQREFCDDLGLSSASLWKHYETGRNLPSLPLLQSLHALGVDINWLLSGDGSMWRKERSRLLDEAETSVNEALGLGTMGLKATRGRIKLRAAILTQLHVRPAKVATLEELQSALKSLSYGAIEIKTELWQLMQDGLITHSLDAEDGEERYSPIGSVSLASEFTAGDKEQAAIDAIETLALEIIPATVSAPPRGVLIKATFGVRPGTSRDVVHSILTHIRQSTSIEYAGEGELEQATILFGACVKP